MRLNRLIEKQIHFRIKSFSGLEDLSFTCFTASESKQVFEVGRTNGVISIRSVRSGGKPGPWEAFQSSGKYRHYGDGM